MTLLSLPTGELNGSTNMKYRVINVAMEVNELDKQMEYLIPTMTSSGKKI